MTTTPIPQFRTSLPPICIGCERPIFSTVAMPLCIGCITRALHCDPLVPLLKVLSDKAMELGIFKAKPCGKFLSVQTPHSTNCKLHLGHDGDCYPAPASTNQPKPCTHGWTVQQDESFCRDCRNEELRCQDCLLDHASTNTLITKGDHHGGLKTVCADRDGCHRRSPG